MVIISTRPYDTSGLIYEYPAGSVERQVLESLSSSEERYRYDSLEELKFELKMRREIVNASIGLNRSRLHFVVFSESFANYEYWDRTNNGGFKLKKGANPGKAINDIYINGGKYGTECATAMVIVYFKALLNIFGEENFNKLFPDIYLMNWHRLDPLLKEVGIPKRVADILIGDRCYFSNPDVDPKTPELQGENVIVLPSKLYYGHGFGITTAKNIIDGLNENRREGATRSAYFMDNSASRPDFKLLYNRYFKMQPSAEIPALLAV